MSAPCPFCNPATDRIFHEDELTLGLWDKFPVSPGHALLVPRRHIAQWSEATDAEKQALFRAVDVARARICGRHQPGGYNIGINDGVAAGQTVSHLHVHVIPRYHADVPDPRGGVRHVIPERGAYFLHPRPPLAHLPDLPHASPLVRGGDDPLLSHLRANLDRATGLDIAVSFSLRSGLRLLLEPLRDLLERGRRFRFLTSDYLGVSEPDALRLLLDLDGNLELRVFQCGDTTFHLKSYIFHLPEGRGVAYVGSSNLSGPALQHGHEWNYRVFHPEDGDGFHDVVRAFQELFRSPRTRVLDHSWIDAYAARRSHARPHFTGVEPDPPLLPPEPHAVQREALQALQRTRAAGHAAGLVVLATGLGKTWLSAFDSASVHGFERILFVAHREEILIQAMATYRRIRPGGRLGHYTGREKATDADVLFASIQTLGRLPNLKTFARDAFDYVVVDEFHHASARTYRNVIEHFKPRFLLGLTATPERTDGGDLLGLCGENLVFRCDAFDGIRRELLCPFHYYGIPDEVDYQNIPWRSARFDEEELTRAVATEQRAQNALEQLDRLGGQRTLAFCCSQRHADFMAEYFAGRGKRCAAVHSGPDSAPRATSLERLERGDLDVVFALRQLYIQDLGHDEPTILLTNQRNGAAAREKIRDTHIALDSAPLPPVRSEP